MSAPIAQLEHVQEILGKTTRAMRWRSQVAIDGHAKAQVELAERGRSLCAIASALAAIPQIHFDLEVWEPGRGGERYLFVPGLGLKRLELDAAGETLVRGCSLDLAVQESGASQVELRRRLDTLLGKPWLALLEPLQSVPDSPRLALLQNLKNSTRVTATRG